MRRFSALLKCRRGTSAVEFALVLTPLLMMMFAVCEYGRLMYVQQGLQEAATAGARCVGMLATSCAVNGTYNAAGATAFIQAEAQKWMMSLPASGVSVSNSTTCGSLSGFSKVTLTYSFQSVLPQMMNLLSGGAPLVATSCFPTA